MKPQRFNLEERKCRSCSKKFRVLPTSVQFVCCSFCDWNFSRWGGGAKNNQERKRRRDVAKRQFQEALNGIS